MTLAAEPTDLEAALHPADDKLPLRLWLRLLTCSNLVSGVVRRRLRQEFDVTLPRFDLLAQLEREPTGMRMGDLSRRLMVSGGNVTVLVDRLELDGLVERKTCADDRRRQMVKLTAKGRRAFARMAPQHHGWIDDMMAGLSTRDLNELQRLLAKLKVSVTVVAAGDGDKASGPV